jgi:beta-glucosidase
MAQDFADYVTVVVRLLGDRIIHWITLNEVFCFTHLGYGVDQVPEMAPRYDREDPKRSLANLSPCFVGSWPGLSGHSCPFTSALFHRSGG